MIVFIVVLLVGCAYARHNLELLNDSDEQIFCWWKNSFNGNLEHSATLGKGQSQGLQTSVGHQFVLAGASGRSYGILEIVPGLHSYRVAVPEPNGYILRNDAGVALIIYKLNTKDGQLVRLSAVSPGHTASVTAHTHEVLVAATREDAVVFSRTAELRHSEVLLISSGCLGSKVSPCGTLDDLAGFFPPIFKSDLMIGNSEDVVDVVVFPNGGNNTGQEPEYHLSVPKRADQRGLQFIKQVVGPVSRALSDRHPEKHKGEWSDTFDVFDRFGRMLKDTAELQQGQLLFLVPQTEYWFWPGMYPGYKVTIPWILKGNGDPVTLETKTLEPRMFAIDDYISEETAQATIEWAEPHLHDSGVVKDGKLGQMDSARTSKTAWVPYTEEFLKPLFNLSATLTQAVDQSLYEPLQFLRYEGDGKHRYESHHDYFGETKFDSQRLITLFIYFSDNPGQGHTVFPRAGMLGTDQSERPSYGVGSVPSMADCSHGYASYPVKRRAVMWYNLRPRGHLSRPAVVDFRSLHGACPLYNCTKMGANHWIHNVPLGQQVPEVLPKLRVQQRLEHKLTPDQLKDEL